MPFWEKLLYHSHSEQIYDQDIIIYLACRLRDGKDINGLDALRAQLIKDENNCKKFFKILR